MGCAEGPRRRRGVHRDGLEEAVISSSDGITFFGTRSPAIGIAFRAAPSERYPNTTPFSTVNERARHPVRIRYPCLGSTDPKCSGFLSA